MAKHKRRNERPKHSPAKRRNRITRYITVEHRESWGDEVRISKSHESMITAMTHKRDWLVVITVWFETPAGEQYFDTYKAKFVGTSLNDDKSIARFELIRDEILSRGNLSQKTDWGWFSTPWTARARKLYTDEADQILEARIEE